MSFKKHNKKSRSSYTPPYPKEILDKPVSELNISDALKELLTNGLIKDVYGVARRNEREIYGVKFFNKKYFLELKKALQEIGVDFRPEEPCPKEDGGLNAPGAEGNPPKNTDKRDAKINGEPRGFRDAPRNFNERGNFNGQKNRPQNDGRRDGPQNGRDRRGARSDDPAKRERRDFGAANKNQIRAQVPVEPRPQRSGPLTEAEWTKYTRNGRWGYIDSSTNQIKIQPIYDEIFMFKEGLACAEKNEKFGYIDAQNNVVIPFEYDLGMSFKDGLACVTKNGKTGYISKDGEVAVEFRFDAAMSFDEGAARVKENGKWLDIDKEGRTLKVY
jgi:hypothetical protein